MNQNTVESWLNTLPLGVDSINLDRWQLKYLPNLERFTKLKYLKCSYNELTKIDNLPTSLQILECDNNFLNEIELPLQYNLLYLNCSFNRNLNIINNLPESLLYLHCSSCNFDKINNLPKSLVYLNCSHNKFRIINNLPESLLFLDCSFCGIKKLNNLPIKLLFLICYSDDKVKLDYLPYELFYLKSGINYTQFFRNLPINLRIFYGEINYLNYFNDFIIWENQLYCPSKKPTKILNLWMSNFNRSKPKNIKFEFRQCINQLMKTKKKIFLQSLNKINIHGRLDHIFDSL